MAYCKKLTREYLEALGIQNVTEDGKVYGKVYKENTQLLVPKINNSGQWIIVRPAIDKNGNRIKQYIDPKRPHYFVYKNTSIPLPRLIYAWFNRIVPEGMVVSNKNKDKSDNRLCNLELITNKESKAKSRPWLRIKKVRNLKSIEAYDADILWRSNYYETAKQFKDEKWAHKLRCEIADLRAAQTYATLVFFLGLDNPKLAEYVKARKISKDEFNKIMGGDINEDSKNIKSK